MSGVRAVDVDLWFDPLCGWGRLTSRWVRRAAADRDLRLTLHPLGLGVIDAPAPGGVPDRLHELAERFARASAAVADGYGQPEVAAFYEALGSRVHEPGGLFSAVRTAGPAELADVRSPAISGPVVGVLPDAGAAVALWDAFVVMAGQDAFFEARRAVARPAALTFLPA